MPTILVTGASRGLGYEFARQYAQAGAHVIATAREPARADALGRLAAGSGGRIETRSLDAADPRSITALAQTLSGRALDIVIANAGVYGGDRQSADSLDPEAWVETLRVNAIGPALLAQALRPNLLAGGTRRFVAITSQMGSIGGSASGNAIAYRSSKAALNMAIACLARSWAGDGLQLLLMHPGWVRTDMGGPGATLSPEESVAGMRRVIDGAGPEASGRFWQWNGTELPW